jgi:hypothetical protein
MYLLRFAGTLILWVVVLACKDGVASRPRQGVDAAVADADDGGLEEARDAAAFVFRDAGPDASASPTARTEACIAYMKNACERSIECTDPWPTRATAKNARNCWWSAAFQCPDLMFEEGSTRTVEGTLACARAYREMPCDAVLAGAAPACAVPGTLSAGAACFSRFQCASHSCGSKSETCGTCNTRVGTGEACDSSHVCPGSETCDQSAKRCMTSMNPNLTPELGIGDACGPQSPGRCGKHICVKDSDGEASHCVARPKVGEDCSMTQACIPSAYCDNQSEICRVLPEAGKPCGAGGRCSEETTCDTSVNPARCVAFPGIGDACTDQCAGEAVVCDCDSPDCAARHCRRHRDIGESCSDAADVCPPGASECKDGVCTPVEWQGLFEKLCGEQ